MTDETAALLERDAENYVKELFAGDAGGHDWFHTMRVTRTAKALAQKTGADPLITALAALLHDADDRKLFDGDGASLPHAAAFLAEHGVPADVSARVLTAITEVSFKGTDSVVPSSPEGKCVQDADRLDAMGAVGIARAFAYGGSRGRAIWDPAEPRATETDGKTYERRVSSSVNHFYEKLLLLKDMMNTDEAKRAAERRDRFMRRFLEEFYAEWDGADV